MKILMATSEAVPFVKTGGLADAVSSLSLSLANLGHEVKIVMPRYYAVDRSKLTHIEGEMGVPVGGFEEWCAVYKTLMPGSQPKNPVEVFFIDHEIFFGRDGVYGNPLEPDFIDNPRRFTFFSLSVFQLCKKINWTPDVVHAHDWPTALVPVFLKFRKRASEFKKTSSILTIHNLGYQGIYHKDNFHYTGLDWNIFYEQGFEDWGMMNMLKAGVYAADKLNTVSQTYCEETKTQANGFRLDGPLNYRSKDYRGIRNGIDIEIWNPEKDKHLPAPYSAKDLSGKALAKQALQKAFGLHPDPDVPVVGMITRLAGQKGVGELFGPGYGSAYSICRDMNLQFVLLGTGESWCENEVSHLSVQLSNFKAQTNYNENLSHLIEAGSDFFLMPSRYEPCGLNQMYSLVYGTLPIVRRTGGLADTVQNYDQKTGDGTGFMFDDLTPSSIYDTVGWAVWAYYNQKEHINKMRVRGMKNDFSWANSAKQYIQMYEEAAASLGALSSPETKKVDAEKKNATSAAKKKTPSKTASSEKPEAKTSGAKKAPASRQSGEKPKNK
ncbi:MAG: glycogen/starch synthase [Spirochaetaceae bacterium]|jgi:starch synthase|nr:glycogen/starch synthase [Spirochaetaceae bacterium]